MSSELSPTFKSTYKITSVPVHLRYKVTMESTFENACLLWPETALSCRLASSGLGKTKRVLLQTSASFGPKLHFPTVWQIPVSGAQGQFEDPGGKPRPPCVF